MIKKEVRHSSPKVSPQVVDVVPIPRSKGLSFYEALAQVVNGMKATRKAWNDPVIYLHMKDGTLNIMLKDGIDHPLLVHLLDIMATDWELIP